MSENQKDANVEIRYAKETDTALILEFIHLLAEYEHLSEEVVATEELLKEWIFEKKKAEVLFAIVDGKEAGFVLFFHNFSTFLSRAGIYLEDLFIRKEYRGQGIGTALLKELAAITIERGCGRLEWSCLDWNEASIQFYLTLDAKQMDEWTGYRLTGDALARMAQS